MADVGVIYVLTTPGPDITFNQYTEPFIGDNDQYYITEIRGLAAPSLRTPTDNVALGDGALIHDFWFGARHIGVEGTILVMSTGIMDDVVQIRNQMESDLQDALISMIRTDGTFAFTPQGQSPISYTVRYEVPLEFTHSNNYMSLDFSFGLIAGDPLV